MDSTLRKDEKYYPQVFVKEYNYIEKKVIRHIIDGLESSSDNSDDSDEWLIKAMKLMFLGKTVLKTKLCKMCFLTEHSFRDQF